MTWFWLSFVDERRPSGDQFLGAAIVGPCTDIKEAVPLAHLRGCNPGGAVAMQELNETYAKHMPDEYRHRLLTRSQCAELADIVRERAGLEFCDDEES